MSFAFFRTGVNVRQSPTRSSVVLKVAPKGDCGWILGGPYDHEGYAWYRIQHIDQVIGYSAHMAGTETLFDLVPAPVDFETILAHTLKWEGGYVNDPADPGGETNYGISKRSYPNLNIKELTLENAKLIYYLDYWLVPGWETLQWPLSGILFDISVLSGKGYADTLRNETASKVLSTYLHHLTEMGGFDTFGRGWSRRVADLIAFL